MYLSPQDSPPLYFTNFRVTKLVGEAYDTFIEAQRTKAIEGFKALLVKYRWWLEANPGMPIRQSLYAMELLRGMIRARTTLLIYDGLPEEAVENDPSLKTGYSLS